MKSTRTPDRTTGPSRRWVLALATAFTLAATVTTIAIAAEKSADPVTGRHGPVDSSGGTLRSPYAALPGTAATGLLPEEVEGLTKGTGMALALAAEVNGYPGPRHVLDAAGTGQLELRADQREAIQRIYDRMLAEAKAKGQEILQVEEQLARRFRHGQIDEANLREIVGHIGQLRAELRYIHLRTHLETKSLLTAEQVVRYNALRGYDAGGGHDQRRGH